MNKTLKEKYREAISHKQESINDYKLAIQHLMEAFQKKNHLNVENKTHTIHDLHSLKKNKINFEEESSPSDLEILKFNQSTQKMIDTLMMKEWLLYKNIESILTLIEKMENKN